MPEFFQRQLESFRQFYAVSPEINCPKALCAWLMGAKSVFEKQQGLKVKITVEYESSGLPNSIILQVASKIDSYAEYDYLKILITVKNHNYCMIL